MGNQMGRLYAACFMLFGMGHTLASPPSPPADLPAPTGSPSGLLSRVSRDTVVATHREGIALHAGGDGSARGAGGDDRDGAGDASEGHCQWNRGWCGRVVVSTRA